MKKLLLCLLLLCLSAFPAFSEELSPYEYAASLEYDYEIVDTDEHSGASHCTLTSTELYEIIMFTDNGRSYVLKAPICKPPFVENGLRDLFMCLVSNYKWDTSCYQPSFFDAIEASYGLNPYIDDTNHNFYDYDEYLAYLDSALGVGESDSYQPGDRTLFFDTLASTVASDISDTLSIDYITITGSYREDIDALVYSLFYNEYTDAKLDIMYSYPEIASEESDTWSAFSLLMCKKTHQTLQSLSDLAPAGASDVDIYFIMYSSDEVAQFVYINNYDISDLVTSSFYR